MASSSVREERIEGARVTLDTFSRVAGSEKLSAIQARDDDASERGCGRDCRQKSGGKEERQQRDRIALPAQISEFANLPDFIERQPEQGPSHHSQCSSEFEAREDNEETPAERLEP